jgi:hypothetical protein
VKCISDSEPVKYSTTQKKFDTFGAMNDISWPEAQSIYM